MHVSQEVYNPEGGQDANCVTENNPHEELDNFILGDQERPDGPVLDYADNSPRLDVENERSRHQNGQDES